MRCDWLLGLLYTKSGLRRHSELDDVRIQLPEDFALIQWVELAPWRSGPPEAPDSAGKVLPASPPTLGMSQVSQYHTSFMQDRDHGRFQM